MRYSVATALAPQAAIADATDYFGPQGVGLEIIDDHETCVTLQGRVLLWCGRLQAVIEDHETCVTLQGVAISRWSPALVRNRRPCSWRHARASIPSSNSCGR